MNIVGQTDQNLIDQLSIDLMNVPVVDLVHLVDMPIVYLLHLFSESLAHLDFVNLPTVNFTQLGLYGSAVKDVVSRLDSNNHRGTQLMEANVSWVTRLVGARVNCGMNSVCGAARDGLGHNAMGVCS